MIIKAKKQIYKPKNNNSVYVNLQIEDINTYYDRFNNALIFNFGLFQVIEDEKRLTETITLTLTEDTKRTGYVLLTDENDTGESVKPIDEYYAEHGNLDSVVKVLNYGMPSIDAAKTFFTGGDGLDNPEINPINDLAKEWLLNTLVFDGELIKENFEFED